MPMDWVPALNYGVDVVINPGITPISLYDFDTVATENPHIVEDDEAGLFIERIVGTIRVRSNDEPSTQWTEWGWRLQPLQGDLEFGGVIFPLDNATTTMMDPMWANMRWWDERFYQHQTPVLGRPHALGDPIDHPWWGQVDIRPRQAFGQKRNLWPSLVVWLQTADVLRVQHRLRMLVKY